MKLSDFNYELPQELIAQDPLEKRSDSRLMVVGREDGLIEHKHFYDILDYVNQGDCLVINDTKVIPARLMGVKEDTGASIEVLLLKRKEEKVWETLVKPGKKARVGARISFGDDLLIGEVVDIVEEGNRLIRYRIPDLQIFLFFRNLRHPARCASDLKDFFFRCNRPVRYRVHNMEVVILVFPVIIHSFKLLRT